MDYQISQKSVDNNLPGQAIKVGCQLKEGITLSQLITFLDEQTTNYQSIIYTNQLLTQFENEPANQYQIKNKIENEIFKKIFGNIKRMEVLCNSKFNFKGNYVLFFKSQELMKKFTNKQFFHINIADKNMPKQLVQLKIEEKIYYNQNNRNHYKIRITSTNAMKLDDILNLFLTFISENIIEINFKQIENKSYPIIEIICEITQQEILKLPNEIKYYDQNITMRHKNQIICIFCGQAGHKFDFCRRIQEQKIDQINKKIKRTKRDEIQERLEFQTQNKIQQQELDKIIFLQSATKLQELKNQQQESNQQQINKFLNNNLVIQEEIPEHKMLQEIKKNIRQQAETLNNIEIQQGKNEEEAKYQKIQPLNSQRKLIEQTNIMKQQANQEIQKMEGTEQFQDETNNEEESR